MQRMAAEFLDSTRISGVASPEPQSPFFSSLINRSVAWLSAPSAKEDAHLSRALAGTLLDHRATLVISGLSTLVAATAAWLMTGADWVIIWFLADLALSLIRIAAMDHSRRHPEVDRMTYLPILMAAGITWSVMTGIVGAICMAQPNPVLAILGAVVTAGYAGGISSRNAAVPRYGLTIICLAILPMSLGTLYSPNPMMPLAGMLIPIWALGTIGILRHNHRILARMMRAEEAMRKQAQTDPLTGLHNRKFVEIKLAELCQRLDAGDQGDEFGLLMIDLDGFKQVNDTHGHSAGDRLLQDVAQRIGACVRSTDDVCRLGGDEFLVILGGSPALNPALVAQRIIEKVSLPVRTAEYVLKVGASIGGAVGPRHGSTPEALMAAADEALYDAKASGKGAYREQGGSPFPLPPTHPQSADILQLRAL